MRVALLRNMPQEGFRSIEVYADRLAGSLRAVAPDVQIVEVRVQAWPWPDWRLPMPYGRAASLRTLGLYLSRWVRYPLALRRVHADVYHILDNSCGHLAFFLEPSRTVVTSHGGTPRSWRRWNPQGPSMWMFDRAFRGMLRAGRIVAVSAYARQELLSEARYPAEQIEVVPHGLDPLFRPVGEAMRQQRRGELLQGGERYLMLHVGHSAARKNAEALYKALASLRRRGWPVRLVRIGGTPTVAQASLIAELGIAEAVTHIPHVPNQELPAYYTAADAFAFPSLYEGFGVPLLEAMACGAPVVCSDSPLFREVCGDAACFADPNQPEVLAGAIVRVLGQPEMARRLQQRGLERSRLFTWERTAQATLRVYRELVGERQ